MSETADRTAIDALVKALFAIFSNKNGARPDVRRVLVDFEEVEVSARTAGAMACNDEREGFVVPPTLEIHAG